MKQALYIKSASAISPQYTFDPAQFLKPAASSENNHLHVIDADYSKYISPVAIRRMSRLLKIGISAGMQCLKDAGITTPNGIITGTAHGSMKDMEQFVQDLIQLNEEALNPTYFIQSTYNSVNGWLAMQSKCTGYNQTYVHRGSSFEMALFDALLMLQDATKTEHYLIGGFDELSDNYYIIKDKIDYWKKDEINSLELLQHGNSTGTIAGEGASFFVATNSSENAVCSVHAVKMLQRPSAVELQQAIANLLQENGLEANDIDLLLGGMNGDVKCQPLYDNLLSLFSNYTTIASYKQLCGEYECAAGFALWLAYYVFSTKEVPGAVIYRKGNSSQLKTILICNNSVYGNVSLILVKSVN